MGRRASHLGTLAEQAESLGDTVGGNLPGAANHLYRAAGLLREEALQAKTQHEGGKHG